MGGSEMSRLHPCENSLAHGDASFGKVTYECKIGNECKGSTFRCNSFRTAPELKELEFLCEQMDSSLYSGDLFLAESARVFLEWYMARWQRSMEEMRLDHLEDSI